MCTRVSVNYVSIMYRCGTSAYNKFCEEKVTSFTRGITNSGHQTNSSIKGPPSEEAERVLRQVEYNFTTLTRTMPMAEIEGLPPSMQPHVVGVP
jgi:hypothetical protein